MAKDSERLLDINMSVGDGQNILVILTTQQILQLDAR